MMILPPLREARREGFFFMLKEVEVERILPFLGEEDSGQFSLWGGPSPLSP